LKCQITSAAKAAITAPNTQGQLRKIQQVPRSR
jgi:hypothetical protein